jgi:hypothetical protein
MQSSRAVPRALAGDESFFSSQFPDVLAANAGGRHDADAKDREPNLTENRTPLPN